MRENQRKVYNYLHDDTSGTLIGEHSGSTKLIFDLPLSKGATRWFPYVLNVDIRDKRTVVIFDGHIPWGGLPKNADVIKVENSSIIKVPIKSVRKPRQEEELNRNIYFDHDNETAEIEIKRYFLLLPKSRAVVRKYRTDSLSPIYVMIEVNEKGVTWRTSSY